MMFKGSAKTQKRDEYFSSLFMKISTCIIITIMRLQLNEFFACALFRLRLLPQKTLSISLSRKKALSTYEHIYSTEKHHNKRLSETVFPSSFCDEGGKTNDIKASCTTTQSEHHHYRHCVNRIIDGRVGK